MKRTSPALASVLALAALLALPAGLAAAQDTEASAPTITVTGEGSSELPPDMALVSLGVTTDGDSAAAALAANNSAQTEVLDALAAAGIEARDVQTSGLSLNPLWDNSAAADGRPKITGYQASNVVTIRVRKLEGLGALLDSVVRTGANQMNSLIFGLSDPSKAANDARREAVEDARAKAEVLASAAGVKLGKLQSIIEGGVSTGPQPMFRRAALGDAAVPVAGGEVGVTASVTLVFLIE